MAIGALPALQLGLGAAQLIGGFLKQSGRRPTYEIPDSVRQALALSRIRASDPYMPGYQQAKDQIDLVTSNAIRGAQESGSAQQSLPGIVGALQRENRNLGMENALSQERDMQGLQQLLMNYGNYEDQEFQMNEFAPYLEREQEGRDMFGAGLENLFGGLNMSEVLKMYGAGGGQNRGQRNKGFSEDQVKTLFQLLSGNPAQKPWL